MKHRCGTLLLVLSVLTGSLCAEILYVDDDAPGDPGPRDVKISDPNEDGSADHPFDSIQEAIDAAWALSPFSSVWPEVTGDTIIVAPGRYLSPDPWEYDEINFSGKSIRLVSSAPTDFSVAEKTVLCGVVAFLGIEGRDCLLQGFKIQNHGHGGILGNYTQATISHCIISGNGPCGATVLKDVQGPVRNCLIVDNTTFHDCGVLPVVSGCPTLINCTIANNLSGVELTNEGLPEGCYVTLRHCIIYGNQGIQVIQQWDRSLPGMGAYFEYCLVDDRDGAGTVPTRAPSSASTIQYGDPSFVRLGRWEDAPTTPSPRPRAGSISEDESVKKILVEGDYRLKTEGWRWSPEPMHGSHWYFDPLTSLAVDAGDPLDSLGEELERAPGDPEGLWGVNHAIDLGAYGGTTQASLAPTDGEAPGIGAVDLRDYWPLMGEHTANRWYVHNPQGNARQIYVSGGGIISGMPFSRLRTANDPDWVTSVNCYYTERTLYMTEDAITIWSPPPTQPPARVQARYPQFLVPGAIIEAPYDPFAKGTAEYRSVLVMRGTVEETLAGTDFDPNQFVMGPWPDVIALRENAGDGAPGQLIAMFARGFGPLMLAGQPVDYAVIDDREFTTSARKVQISPRPRRDPQE